MTRFQHLKPALHGRVDFVESRGSHRWFIAGTLVGSIETAQSRLISATGLEAPQARLAPMHHRRVTLQKIERSESEALRPMLDAYLGELSTHRARPVGATDAKTYRYLSLYWSEPDRHPLFLFAQGQRIGFALVYGSPESAEFQMAEFHVCEQFRRRGNGRAAVGEIWRRFPGAWQLQVHRANIGAFAFWRGCTNRFALADPVVTEIESSDGPRFQFDFCISRDSALHARSRP